MRSARNTRLSQEGLIGFVLHAEVTHEPATIPSLIAGAVVSARAGRLPRPRPVPFLSGRQGRLAQRTGKPAAAQQLEKLLEARLAG